jgi:hypothetical protein
MFGDDLRVNADQVTARRRRCTSAKEAIMTTQSLCSKELNHLSDQQEMFLLRAAYGPTLTFEPRRTQWLVELLDHGLVREHADRDVHFSTLRLTLDGWEASKCILAAANARDSFERAKRLSDREREENPMLQYFLDVHSSEGAHTDQIGTVFVNAAAARSEALTVVGQMARLREEMHAKPLAITIVIRDEDGQVVDTVCPSDQPERPRPKVPNDTPDGL